MEMEVVVMAVMEVARGRGGRGGGIVVGVVIGFDGEVAGPENVVLIELVAGGTRAGASVVGRCVGKRAEEAVGGCGFLVAEPGLAVYVHDDGSGQESMDLLLGIESSMREWKGKGLGEAMDWIGLF